MAARDGTTLGKATAKIVMDSSGLVAQSKVAVQASKSISKALADVSKEMQNQQRLAIVQAQTVLAAVRAQQAQITATTRAESALRINLARAEATATQQAAKVSAAQQIEAERRLTAEVKSQMRMREQAHRANLAASSGGAGGIGGMMPALGGVGRMAGGVAAGLGIAVGVAALVRTGAESAQLAGQNERTAQSFESLATKANVSSTEMLAAMKKASKGLIDDSQLILGANQAMISGVAKSTEDLTDLLAVAQARGAATGRSTQEAFQRLVTGISRREVEVLDELGIRLNQNDVFANYAKGLGTTADRLTEAQKSAALFNRVIADSRGLVEANANRAETAGDQYDRLATSTTNAKDAVGGLINTLGAADAAGGFATGIDTITDALRRMTAEIRQAKAEGAVGVGVGANTVQTPGNLASLQNDRRLLEQGRVRVLDDIATGARPASVTGPLLAEMDAKLRAVNNTIVQFDARLAQAAGRVPGAPPWLAGVNLAQGAATSNVRTPEQKAVIQQWATDIAAIEQDAANQRTAATRQFEAQRAQVISQYGESISREAADFARSRANKERQFAEQVAEIQEEAGKRQVKAAADLAERIVEAQADAAKQAARWQRDLDRNLEEMRADSADRVADIEKRFAEDRERAAKDSADRIMDAAGRLDAKAVYEEQRSFAKSEAEAVKAHDEHLTNERENLQERIAEANEGHQRQLADAREALQERIDDAHRASAKQLEEARIADAERLTDMQTAHDDQKRQEDIERGIRLQRQAEDHGKQLAALATAHDDRVKQIAEQERTLKTDRQNAFLAQLADFDLFHDEFLKRQKKLQEDQLKLFDAFWEAHNKRFVVGEVPSIANPTAGVKYPPIKMPEGIGPVENNPFGKSAFDLLPYGSMYNVPMPAPASNVSTANSRTVTVGNINPTIVLGDVGNRSDADIKRLVMEGMVEALEGLQ
jgi:hypothetical protein